MIVAPVAKPRRETGATRPARQRRRATLRAGLIRGDLAIRYASRAANAANRAASPLGKTAVGGTAAA
jgi:hypothetical protein